MILTSEIPLDQKERFSQWAKKFEALNQLRPHVKVPCYMCEAEMHVSYRESKALIFKPTCSEGCRIDLNNLKVFTG